MTPAQCAELMALGAGYDMRLTPPTSADATVRAKLWAEALSPLMSYEWAVRQIVSHYARTNDSITPAALNAAWKSQVKRNLDARSLEQARKTGVPPTTEYQAAREQLRKARA